MKEYTFIPAYWRDTERKDPFEHLVGQGWWPLLHNLCQKIQNLIDQNPAAYQDLMVTQIKEKYGTLRFYLNWETEEISQLIQEATIESAKICEVCGKPGRLRTTRGWQLTLCDACHKKPNPWQK